MTPERLDQIEKHAANAYTTADAWRDPVSVAVKDVYDLFEHIALLEEDLRLTRAERDAEKHKNLVVKQELHLYKTQMREARAIAWDVGAQAGLDWDKNYPGNIRDSNPFKENK